MFPAWTWIVGFFLGATIGSFLNVVIYRTPRNLSLSNPKHSFCPKCKHRLGPADLLPLLSWILSRGKCRHCGKKVTSRYFWVEFLNGSIWAGLWWQYFVASSDPARAICYALAASILVVIIFVDWELYIIPDSVNGFLLLVGLGYNAWLYYKGSPMASLYGVPSSIIGALVGIAVLWGIAFLGRLLFGKDAMGHGDIKMARGIGAVLLPTTALISFGLAVVLGVVLGVAQVLALRRADGADDGTDLPDGVDGIEGESPPNPGHPKSNTISEDEPYEPESIPSLLQSGLGYILCIDLIGQFFPELYRAWFHEDPFLPFEEVEDFEVERTMIPFGPYLALGAILAAVFQTQILGWASEYWNWATGGGSNLSQLCLEQLRVFASL